MSSERIMLDKEEKFLIWAVALIITFTLVATIMASSMGIFESEVTCETYGEVPVRIDNQETICVPWEKVSEFSLFKEE